MKDMATHLRGRIIEARRTANLSQQEVASALGLEPTAISKIENGARDVSSTELARIAQVCGRSLSWFFGDEDSSVVMSLRSGGASTEALKDLAWANEFAEAFAFLKKMVS
jgi:transcriptional regulator with XRE-family HTH domain